MPQELRNQTHHASVTIFPNNSYEIKRSVLLELIFGHYDPQHLGIIDFHGPYRAYSRESMSGITFSDEAAGQRLRQHALYNYANKYSQLKTEMAGLYVRRLIGGETFGQAKNAQTLDETLKELFRIFLPGKEFLGPRLRNDGTFDFTVRTASGAEHDIDELSAGEKEVLFGYLRLKYASPMNSVILIDEPELHLNPRLVSGLAQFYHQHIGEVLRTQLWLVTHSDTLMREAVGREGFSVYHMRPPSREEPSNQASVVTAALDIDRVVIDLVGDLAAYRPGAKIVVFEGVEDGFDIRMVNGLFPEFRAATNSIPGGNKAKVRQLYELLSAARERGHLPGKFYAVTDADSDLEHDSSATKLYSWDAYHIENYLIEPEVIRQVLDDLHHPSSAMSSIEGVEVVLKECATETMNQLVAHKLRVEVNQRLVGSLDLRIDATKSDVAQAMTEAVGRSRERMIDICEKQITAEWLHEREGEIRRCLAADLNSGDWRRSFQGREILKRFAGRLGGSLNYEAIRELVFTKMRSEKVRPKGMKAVVEAILND